MSEKLTEEQKNVGCGCLMFLVLMGIITWLAWPGDNTRVVDGVVIVNIEGHDYIQSADGSKTHSASCPCHTLRGGE
jgi:hypothetical protein